MGHERGCRVEDIVPVGRCADEVRTERTGHVAPPPPGAVGRPVEILLVGLLRLDAREVVGVGACPEARRQVLREAPPERIAAPRRTGRQSAVGSDLLLVEQRELRVSAGGARHDVSIFPAELPPRLRHPVVVDRRVLAPVDRPEEGGADGVPLHGGRSVDRHQEPGSAVILLHGIIEGRQVHQGHALHPEYRVGQERILVEVDCERPGRDFPSRRRLHARGKAASEDAVLRRPELLELRAPEVGVRLL